MDDESDDNEDERFRPGPWDSRIQESMRGRGRKLRNPSVEDRKIRNRNRRTAGGDVQKRAELVRALNKTSSFVKQARLLDEINKLDQGLRAEAAMGRELDFADTIVQATLNPVRVHEHHTEATDWLGAEASVDPQWHNRVIAEAAMWFGRVPDFVKQDAEEFRIQAEGKARQLSGQFGIQAQAAMTSFLDYTTFLHKQSASGLDQIQQTVDPNNSPRTTPLPTDVFDNFAPDIHPINQGVSGTESSDRAPLIQEIVNGGSGMDGGAPEKPGGHSTDDELSWSPPEGMQQDTAPGWSDGDPGTPEKGGDRPDYGKQSSLYGGPGMAIGYTMNMDDYRRQAARHQAGWPFSRKQEESAPAPEPVKVDESLGGIPYGHPNTNERFDWMMSDQDRTDAEDRIQEHDLHGCPPGSNCPGAPYHGMERFHPRVSSRKGRGQGKGRKEAASGLPMIQETVDANNQPHAPSPIPPDVAFPLDEEFQEEWTTNGTGTASPGGNGGQPVPSTHNAGRKQADMYGNSDEPHAVVQPDVANSPATTPPPAVRGGGQEAGRADAQAEQAPDFGDDSSRVPAGAQGYAEGYSSVSRDGRVPQDVPGSMAGPGNGVTHAGAKVSSLIVTAAEREDPDFRKGYGYASRWKPGTRLVTMGSKEFEAGVYAGISDNPGHQKAFVEAHRAVREKYPKVAERADRHKRVTAHVVARNEVPSNGLYLLSSTSIDLNTTAPNTTPAADGSTPINGPGRPGPLAGGMDAAAPGGPSPYNGAQPFGVPVVPGAEGASADPADALIGGGGMSTPSQVMASQTLAFRQRVQDGLLKARQGR